MEKRKVRKGRIRRRDNDFATGSCSRRMTATKLHVCDSASLKMKQTQLEQFVTAEAKGRLQTLNC
jgi:hypothetical protein